MTRSGKLAAALLTLSLATVSFAQKMSESAKSTLDAQSGSISGVKFQRLTPLPITSHPDFLGGSVPGSGFSLRSSSASVPAFDTVPFFSRSFFSHGFEWPYTMIGGDPARGHKTRIPVKIIAVSLELQNADLQTTTLVPIGTFEQPILNSPNFQEADYTSGEGIQFGDAVQRAEFFHVMKENWHTELHPVEIVGRITIKVPRFVTVQVDVNGTPTPTQVRTYFRGVAGDGSVFVLLLDRFFNDAFFNTAVDAINAGSFTTDAINLAVLPNTFIFSLEQGVQGSLELGGHTLFFVDATPTPIWVTGFASWISPGVFIGSDLGDVTTLSHEISEAINDPFLSNQVPAWEFPGFPGSCQDNLETGDPIEVLPQTTVAIPIEKHGRTFVYHPQTEALLQWFEQNPKSNALGGAFSYPDTRALTGPAKFFGQLRCPAQ
jgi:hypothetical protein